MAQQRKDLKPGYYTGAQLKHLDLWHYANNRHSLVDYRDCGVTVPDYAFFMCSPPEQSITRGGDVDGGQNHLLTFDTEDHLETRIIKGATRWRRRVTIGDHELVAYSGNGLFVHQFSARNVSFGDVEEVWVGLGNTTRKRKDEAMTPFAYLARLVNKEVPGKPPVTPELVAMLFDEHSVALYYRRRLAKELLKEREDLRFLLVDAMGLLESV